MKAWAWGDVVWRGCGGQPPCRPQHAVGATHRQEEQGGWLSWFGREPVGAFVQPSLRPLIPALAHAILQLAVDVQVPQCFGGVGGQVVYIDTEGGFLLQRVVDIATAAVRHCSLLVEDDEQRVAMETFTMETILSNMFLVRCHDYMELLAELHLLPDFLSEHPRVRLLVIDSVAFPFRRHFDELSQRTRLLNGLAQQLIALATSREIAVVITNQMTTRLRGGQSQLVPALGENWGHAPTTRLLLYWAGPQRLAAIFKSAGHMDSTVQYQITSEGFRDADQSEQPQRKRPRTHSNQSAASQRDSSC
ncbi:DNA repair protein RAD51 homolog 3-like [Morone saxatilis]|uniref:DNA repair protein RAD51 homolog 3-like n=1 Tax=Morone saxatilis TaxID=34816 RepID=UPI0015E1C4C0|nr:DNA repair protein RAD51 homolog 3-like [Morone saxatilis]